MTDGEADGDAPEIVTTDSGSQNRSRFLRLAGRASWNIVDQVLTAVTNAVMFLVLARSVSTGSLDAFSNAFYVFTMVIGVQRATVGQVLGIRFSDIDGAPWRAVLRQSLGLTLAGTTVISVILALVALPLDSLHRTALLATALVLPGLIMQDACRMAFFTRSRARDAALNDLLWAVLQFSGVALLIGAGQGAVSNLILAWGGSATVCSVVALYRLRVVPDVRQARAWLRRTGDVSRFMLGENLLTVGAFNGGFVLVGVLAGEGAVSAIRGAQVLLGPLQTLVQAMFTFTLPELSRRSWLPARTRIRVSATASLGMLTAAVTYTILLLLLPTPVGTFLFGDNWAGSRSILLPVAIGAISAAVCLGPAVMIYAMGKTRQALGLIMIEAPIVITLMLGGALLGGVRGAAWGLAATQTLMVPLWFAQLLRILRRAQTLDLSGHGTLPTPSLDGEPAGPVTPSRGTPRAIVDR